MSERDVDNSSFLNDLKSDGVGDSSIFVIEPYGDSENEVALVGLNDGFYRRTASLEIPEFVDEKRVVAIKKDALKECYSSLRWLTIPQSVKVIETGAFAVMRNLCSVDVADNNPEYSSENGVLFNREKKTLLYYPPKRGGESYDVPNGTETISDHAFTSSDVVKVTIPPSVKKVEKSAFSFCSNLEEVNIPEGVGVLPNRVFAECERLRKIEIPASVRVVSESAFMGCKSLGAVEIPEGVTRIASKAFSDCLSLKSVYIPKSVTEIEPYAFLNCDGLESIEVDEDNPNFASENGVLFDKEKRTLISYPQGKKDKKYAVPASVQKIDGFAFMGCLLEKVVVPDGVTELGRSAFESSPNLRVVDLPATIKEILFATFQGCSSLKDVSIPEGVVILDKFAFYDCSALQRVRIPASVKKIDESTFKSCPSLETIKIAVGNSRYEFRNASIIDKITNDGVLKLNPWDNSEENVPCDEITQGLSEPACYYKLELYYGKRGIQSGGQNVDKNYFTKGKDFVDPAETLATAPSTWQANAPFDYVDLAETLAIAQEKLAVYSENYSETSDPLGIAALYWNVRRKYPEIAVFPEDGRNDQFTSFNQLSRVKVIVIPASVHSINFADFIQCKSLCRICVVKNNERYALENGVLFDKEKKTLLFCLPCEEYVVPEGVETIGVNAFVSCRSLKRIFIPASVKSIEKDAFLHCSSLEEIKVAPGNQNYCVMNDALVYLDRTNGKKKLIRYPRGNTNQDYVVPSEVETIEFGAFYSNVYLKEVTIPEGVVTIEQDAFRYCANLENVKISKTVETIGECAFSNCHNLKKFDVSPENQYHASRDDVLFWKKPSFILRQYSRGIRRPRYEIPNGVVKIYHYAFNNRKGLVSVVIPGSVETIGDWAFFGCPDLLNVEIQDGVQMIMSYAFNRCTRLTSVDIPGSVKKLGEAAFQNCSSLEMVTLADGVEEIGLFAFNLCPNLRDVYIPASVKKIGERAFAYAPVKVHAPVGSYAIDWAIEREIAYAYD